MFIEIIRINLMSNAKILWLFARIFCVCFLYPVRRCRRRHHRRCANRNAFDFYFYLLFIVKMRQRRWWRWKKRFLAMLWPRHKKSSEIVSLWWIHSKRFIILWFLSPFFFLCFTLSCHLTDKKHFHRLALNAYLAL